MVLERRAAALEEEQLGLRQQIAKLVEQVHLGVPLDPAPSIAGLSTRVLIHVHTCLSTGGRPVGGAEPQPQRQQASP